ncbi:MAG TPA: CDP-alcohol phosphatidyltransferase family protein [Terriglobales bacterium]|nr:CDP-alcohol phosphatidyltransferase family protein [Terriglobales bacterium]
MLRQLRTFPNQLTLLRLVFIPFIVICVLDGTWGWALALFVLAGLSDGLDGLLARLLHQKTELGRFLDPIADKLLLSTLFLVLSFAHKVPWYVTVLVLSRDVCIVAISATIYATTSFRAFKPSLYGKANTVVQVAALFLVLLREIVAVPWIFYAARVGLWSTFALTLISGIHYAFDIGKRVHASTQ